jgi:hypothetical protein
MKVYEVWTERERTHTTSSLSFALLMAFKDAQSSEERCSDVWVGSGFVATVMVQEYPALPAETVQEEILKCA